MSQAYLHPSNLTNAHLSSIVLKIRILVDSYYNTFLLFYFFKIFTNSKVLLFCIDLYIYFQIKTINYILAC